MKVSSSLAVDDMLSDLICSKLGHSNCSLEKVSDPGSSKSRVYLYRAGETLIAAKVAPLEIVTYRDPRLEPVNRLYVSEFLGHNTAEIYWHGEVDGNYIMLYECVGQNSLHNEIQSSAENTMNLVTIWEESMESLAHIWAQTQRKVDETTQFARNYDDRLTRIIQGVESHVLQGTENTVLGEYLDYEVIVNGRRFPSLRQTLELLKDQDTPDFTVTCHGDPQPSNIIVGEDKKLWQFIDWEWSQEGHDWRMMAAHMYGWWLTRHVSFKETPRLTINTRTQTITITYTITPDKKRSLFMQKTMDVLNRTTGLQNSPNDYRAFQKFLALLSLGEIRFLPIWNTTENFPYLIALATELSHKPEEVITHA